VIGLSPSSNAVAYSPSSNDIAYCAGCVVVVYDAKSNLQRQFLRAASSSKPFVSVAYSADGFTLAAGESGSQPAVVVWEAASGRCVAELKGHKHGVASISFSPAGQHNNSYPHAPYFFCSHLHCPLLPLFSSNSISNQCLRDEPPSELPTPLLSHIRMRMAGKFLVSCGATYDGQICFWNWTSQTLLTRERTQVDLRSVTFSEDGSSVISAGKGHLRVRYHSPSCVATLPIVAW
jgi:WD40 repeat protein